MSSKSMNKPHLSITRPCRSYIQDRNPEVTNTRSSCLRHGTSIYVIVGSFPGLSGPLIGRGTEGGGERVRGSRRGPGDLDEDQTLWT